MHRTDEQIYEEQERRRIAALRARRRKQRKQQIIVRCVCMAALFRSEERRVGKECRL